MEGLRVLFVDDEDDFRETIVKRLNARKIQAMGAESGVRALEIVKDNDFDVIVLDVKMPGMDGIETLRHIKQMKPEIEVIMLTGHASVEFGLKGMQLGAFDYVMKPAPLNELLEKRFQTKVAMRTASPREISGAVGGLGVCGCMLCCHDGVCARTSVDVRLAKQHGVPMHDSAASGLCGRLKCCIGYETDGVEDNSVRQRPERRGATR